MFDVIINVQVVCTRSFSDTVNNCTCLGSADGIDGYPVFAADREIPQCPLRSRIVYGDFAVGQEYLQIFFLIHAVLQTHGGFTFRKNRTARKGFSDPRKILFNQWSD